MVVELPRGDFSRAFGNGGSNILVEEVEFDIDLRSDLFNSPQSMNN